PASTVNEPISPENTDSSASTDTPATESGAIPSSTGIPPPSAARYAELLQPSRGVLSILAIFLVVALIASYLAGYEHTAIAPPHIAQLTHSGHLAPGVDAMESLAPAATDGVRLFAATIDNGHDEVASVSLADGSVTPLSVPAEVAGPTLGDISPDGSRLLLRDHLSPESEQPLWAVPTVGGSALRIGNVLAHDATWMPNNGGILYANGNNLFLSVITSSTPTLYAALPGRAYWLR